MKMLGCTILLLASALSSFAAPNQPDRIPGAITNQPSVKLTGNVHPKATSQNDKGAVEPGMKLDYMTMVFEPTTAQKADLKQFLADLQTPSSPDYHHWLTPEKYADRFGVSQRDMKKMENWLTAQGFVVVQPARGRGWIVFSGTARLVEQVFQTQIHHYLVNGEKHIANATNPSIPKSLAGIVIGFRGMDDFKPKPMNVRKSSQAVTASPFYSAGGFNNLGPADIATIYDLGPLYSNGTTGSGQNVVIVGQSDINTADIANFRSGFGLSATLPTITHVPGTPDPGIKSGDVDESSLDIEWVGAVAQDATINFVIAGSINGVFDSAQYAIDQNLAPVISMSYGGCETANATFITYFEPILQQASAQGITFLAASGDSGAAACDDTTEATAAAGLAVNYPASSPEVTGVGGTEFSEGSGNYWGTNGTNLGSALSYIPEIAWNDSDVTGTGGFNGPTLAGTGGGKSSCGLESGGACTGGFPKPTWQVGTGVPNDGVRDVPDVSMAASANHDGYFLCSESSCAGGITSDTFIVGGTSASTPVFAGIVTLLNQYVVSTGAQSAPGLGNINTQLYQLAQTNATAFHDITSGSNIVPCAQTTPGCPASAPFQYGYSAGAGYDRVTGLGSVDANNLAVAFAGTPVKTTTVLTTSPSGNVQVGSSATLTLTATVSASSGSGTPTGTVTFLDNGTTTLGTATLASGTGISTPITLAGGEHSLTAVYAGDTSFPGSTSTADPVLVTLNMHSTTGTMASPTTAVYGNTVTLSATVNASSGPTPTGTVTFTNGLTVLGVATLTSGSGSLVNVLLPGGTDTITASYNGDATYGLSTGTTPVVITQAATTTTVASTNVLLGAAASLTATIGPATGSAGPSGMVTFFNGSTNIGSTMTNAGVATLSYSTAGLAAGPVTISASYGGDGNYAASVSPNATLTIQDFTITPNATITVTAPGQSGTTMLTVTPLDGFAGGLTYTCTGAPSEATCTAVATSTGATVTVTTTAATSNLIRSGRGGMFYALLLPGMLGLVFMRRSKRVRGGAIQMVTMAAILGLSTLWMGACGGGGSSSNAGTPTGMTNLTVTATSGTLSHTATVVLNVQ